MATAMDLQMLTRTGAVEWRTAEGLEAFMRYAHCKHGSGVPPIPTSASPHKDKHDAEQRAWLGGECITIAGIRYSNIEPDHEMRAEPVPTGVNGRLR